MKIINDTATPMSYVVTASARMPSGSSILASGWIGLMTAIEFSVPNAGNGPIVYVKPAPVSGGWNGYFIRKVANGNSTVTLTLDET